MPIEMVALEGYSESGKAEELMIKCGLTPEGVKRAAAAVLARKGR